MKKAIFSLILVFSLIILGCSGPKINLFPDPAEPLQEFTLSGKGKNKVLVISVRGTVSDQPEKRMFGTRPSMVQEIISQLRRAEKDQRVKAVLLKVNTPGGSATASDILYHEILTFKQRHKAKVVVALMGLATSGGYYLSLPADLIIAHPTTVTGSVGVIFIQPKIQGLLEKIGVGVEVQKFGKNKDMASPFRPSTEEEREILNRLTGTLGNRFIELVEKHRKLDQEALATVATARVFSAQEAHALGLVDEIGYLSSALDRAKKLAGLAEDDRVVVYRRNKYGDDNIYNNATLRAQGVDVSLVDTPFSSTLTQFTPGFYYMWMPGSGQ